MKLIELSMLSVRPKRKWIEINFVILKTNSQQLIVLVLLRDVLRDVNNNLI